MRQRLAVKCAGIALKSPQGLQGDKMYKVIKIFFLVFILLIAAFFANYFELVSIPWLDINSVPTYSDDANKSHDAVEKALAD